MRKWGKWLAFAIILVLTAAIACSKQESTTDASGPSAADSADADTESTGTPAEQEPVSQEKQTFTMMHLEHPSFPYNKDWMIWRYIEEKTGVTFDVEVVPNVSVSDWLNLAVASNSMPDMMIIPGAALANKFGAQGAFLNILDYAGEMPHFRKWMEQYPVETQAVKSADGRMFMFPNQGFGELNRVGWLFRKDIFEKHQLTPPADFDELYAVLKQLKQLYPTNYPFLFRDGVAKLQFIAPTFGTRYDMYYDEDHNEWRYGAVEEHFRRLIEYMNLFYKDGLIVPDFLTLQTKSWQDMMATDQGFVTIDYLARIDFFNETMREQNPDFNLAFLPPPAGVPGIRKNYNKTFLDLGIAIASTAKKPKEIMHYMDWLFSEDGRDTMSWGKEGETFTVEGGTKQFKPEYRHVNDLMGKTGMLLDPTYTWLDEDIIVALSSPDFVAAIVESRAYDTPPPLVPAFTESEAEFVNINEAAIIKTRDENVAKFILGTRPLSEWSDYVEEMNRLGLPQLIRIYTDACARVQQ